MAQGRVEGRPAPTARWPLRLTWWHLGGTGAGTRGFAWPPLLALAFALRARTGVR